MIQAHYSQYLLNFKRPSGTSRGVMTEKETWFISLEEEGRMGIGECGLLRGLSIDDRADFEARLHWVCQHIDKGLAALLSELNEFPSIQFGLEQAFLSLQGETSFELFPSAFTAGAAAIPINGLIWMGDAEFMQAQIRQKLESGFTCIKMKIGAIDFNTELALLRSIRNEFSVNEIELRVDANGAFSPETALEKLKLLSDLELHSIEQPIKQGQFEEMARLCELTPLPIALDEELIGVFDVTKKKELLHTIQPQYVILKPSLIGGYQGSEDWITSASAKDIGWWVTSALESNIGLNAIAQWTHTLQNTLPQGLGTGGLFTNNFDCPLLVEDGTLSYRPERKWNFNLKLE